MHHAAYSHPDNLEFILEFIDKHIDQFNVTSLRSLFFAKNQTQSNFLHLVAYHSSITAIDRIFKFLNKHIDFYDETHLQELLLKKTCNGWHSLSAFYRHSTSIKIILDFINANIDKFPKEVLKEIIFQKNKHDYTCLHLAARFQPDSLLVILNFIEQHFELFANDLKPLFKNTSKFQRFGLFFQKTNSQPNLLELSSKHQPESAKLLTTFLTANANYFKQTPSLFKKLIDETANNALLTQNNCTDQPYYRRG
ncbi:MAG: hypothetical protein RLY40_1033 [Pseudomonadota bacterium]